MNDLKKHFLYQNLSSIKVLADIGGIVANANLAFFVTSLARSDLKIFGPLSYITTALQIVFAIAIAFFALQKINSKSFNNDLKFKKEISTFKKTIIALGISAIAIGFFAFVPIGLLSSFKAKKVQKKQLAV